MSLLIDWNNIPTCGDHLTISPYLCQVRVKEVWSLEPPPPKIAIYDPPTSKTAEVPPAEVPPAEVPVVSTALLFALGLACLIKIVGMP